MSKTSIRFEDRVAIVSGADSVMSALMHWALRRADAIGHPCGMSRAPMSGHVLIYGRHRGANLGVVTLCVDGGMGAARSFETYLH
jgi:thiolase-like protein